MTLATIDSRLFRTLKAPSKHTTIHCNRVRGLMLNLYPFTDAKATFYGDFVFRYLSPQNSVCDMDLGQLNRVSIPQVVQRARALSERVARGGNPAAEMYKRPGMPTLDTFIHYHVLPYIVRRDVNDDNWNTPARLISAALGHKALDEISLKDTTEFEQWMHRNGCSNGTIYRCLRAFYQAMNMAVLWKHIPGPSPIPPVYLTRPQQ